jgi:hypothetical protein
VLTSNATPGISGSGSLTAQYTNGSGNNTIISQYNYAGLNPQSGISLSAVNNFTFSADTVDSSQSTQVTIENTGNVNESNFVFSFSPNQYFTITTGTGATPCSVTNNTITSTLAAGNSCSITLTYNNPNIASSSSTMMINYNYNGQAATQVSKTMSYSTTQATASIGFNPASPYTFNSIIANGIESDTQIFTITNNGPDAVNGLFNTAITGDFNIMPSTGANDCQTKSNLASGQNCTLTLRFGPTATAANPAVGTFTLSGTSATGGTINSVMTLNGNARTPLSANVQIYSIGHSASVVYGDGESAGSAFQIELTNAAGLAGFTLYYKNTGAFAATNFTVDTSSLPSGYTVDSDSTCGDGNTMTLESNGANYCYVILKPNTNSPGNLNITLTSMPATWTDERGPQTPQTISWDNGTNTQNTIYVNVFASPQVTAVMSSSSSGTPTITNPTENTDFYVVYTLTGGYSGQSFTYGVTLGGTSGSPAMSVYSPTTCTITSPATSCSIKIASGGAATNQSITYAPQGGAVTPTPASSGNFNVVAAVPTWKVVGNADFSAGSATLVTLALTANSIPYVAYADGANGSKVTVMKLDGSIWKYIGESGFSDGQATGSNISLGVDSSGTPYVAYVDASFNSGYGGVAVKKFNGTAWVNVGQNNMVSAGVAAYPSLAISSSDVPYLAYKNDQMGQIYAKAVKFNNNSGSWDDIGTDGKVTAANADWISLALNSSDQPFIACLDGNGQAGVLVRTYDGNSWQDVGSKITSSNDSYINIALNSSGNPRVGYLNNTNAYPTAAYNDNSGPASQWSFYGQSSGFDNNTATSYISLALDTSGNPYLAFQDDPNGSLGRRKTASVITWSNSTWSYVGESQITSGEAKYTSLKLNSSNVPYLAFSDEANGGKVMVMFYK